jgi:hypothetical protein
MNSLFVGAVYVNPGTALQSLVVSGIGANPFAGTPPPVPVVWKHTFDFTIDQWGFSPLVRSPSDIRAVYTPGSGYSHGGYSNVIQISYPTFASTTLTKIAVTVSAPFISGEYLQFCETADSAVCNNGYGSGTNVAEYILPQTAFTSLFVGVINGPSNVVLQKVDLYGVGLNPVLDQRLQAFGVTASLANGWSDADRQALLSGVTAVGQAFSAQYGGGSPADAFKRVLFFSGRTTIEFVRSASNGEGVCETNNNVAAPLQAQITCDHNNQFSQYTAVHELGHVFVGRTGGYSQGSTFFGLMDQPPLMGTPGTPSPVLVDSNHLVVMGNRLVDNGQGTLVPDWARGGRGWGSTASIAPTPPCNFQQDPFTANDWEASQDNKNKERDEAAADMFLNWVYQTVGVGGFADIDWRTITDCGVTPTATDAGLPGNARSGFMSFAVMPTLATYIPTSTPTPTP